MTTEEKLKELIQHRYNSIREFAISIDMPYSTIDSIFRRGIGNSSVSNIIKICKALKISADALADGEFISVQPKQGTPINDRFEITEVIEDTREFLTHSGFVTIEGKPLSKSGAESLMDAIDVGIEIAKKKSNV